MDERIKPASLSLPEVMDLKAAAHLTTQLQALRGQDLQLDASDVRRLGSLCLQVLLSAKATWQADGGNFSVEAASEAFLADAALLGIPGVGALCAHAA